MKYSDELNDIQDATIAGITIMRDNISDVLNDHLDDQPDFKKTVWELVLYQSERSQTVSYLVSSNYIWDAEMILRSFYEANVKIWYLCSLQGIARDVAVKEFWGAFHEVHAHKRRVKAGLVRTASQNFKSSFNDKIFSALEDETIFNFGNENKKERREIEQRWSFSNLIKKLHSLPKGPFDFSSIQNLEHTFGLQSHLLHADVSALDLMLDRRIRKPDDLEALTGTHICRIFSDQISMWMMTSIAIWSCSGSKNIKITDEVRCYKKVHDLMRPFYERFEASQTEKY